MMIVHMDQKDYEEIRLYVKALKGVGFIAMGFGLAAMVQLVRIFYGIAGLKLAGIM